MKKLYTMNAGALVLIFHTLLMAEGVVDSIEKAGKKILTPVEMTQKIFPTSIEEKKERLAELEKKKAQIEEGDKKFFSVINADNQDIKSQLDAAVELLKNEPDDEFLNKKIALLNERYQTINALQHAREQLLEVVEEHITLLQEYLKDQHLKEYKNCCLTPKSSYSLEELQNVTQLIVEKEKAIAQIIDQEKNIDAEIENRKRTALAAIESYKKKKDEQAKLEGREKNDLRSLQKIELLQLEEKLALEKNEADSMRLQELEQKKILIKSRLFLSRLQLEALKEALYRVKPAVQVSEADLAVARDELVKKQQELIALNEQRTQNLELLTRELKIKEKERHESSNRYGIALDTELDEWSKQPKDSVHSYVSFLTVANVNDAVLLLHRERDFISAQMVLDEARLRHESLSIDIKNAFYKINTHTFASEDETRQERKKFDIPKADLQAQIAQFQDTLATIEERLAHQKKALIHHKELRQKIATKRETLFKNRQQEYADILELLNSAEQKISQQIELLQKTQALYVEALGLYTSTLKHIDFIRSELELTTIWQRSKYAITWGGFQAIIPDLETFITDTRIQVIQAKDAFVLYLQKILHEPRLLVILFIYLCVFFIIILGFRRILPVIARGFIRLGSTYRPLRGISFVGALIIGFFGKHAVAIVLWLIMLLWVHYYASFQTPLVIIFYLVSIPWLLYIANRFIIYFEQFNVIHNYIFVTQHFQRRFMLVTSTLLYATISIFLFREAFLLANYPTSELPTILLALNFIIFQVALIFLIAKEQILTIIPTSTDMWRWVAIQVDRFYYLILMFAIAIIVMSNPYVGFGKLVWHILKRIIFTIVLIRVLLWFNLVLRRGLSYVFFSRGEEFVRERFAYGKTVYGFLAVTLFLFFIIIACIVGAKIWGWPEAFAKIHQWADIVDWLQTPILLEKSDNPISVFTILKLLFFIIMGFFAAFVVDSFVLDKIFDVLLVDSGVQNTISSLARYLILMMTLILGFQSVGLGELVLPLIGALVLGIGWVIKDPISDFIAYFIILVQRPVKIGDYIKMDEDTHGVVRKITARSVIVRRKNSTTIVLPNSLIINKPLVNWNYVRGFVAFEDIMVTVAYTEDPAQVKAILLKVMDENPFVLKNPNPIVRLDNFGEYGFVFMARGFLSSNYTLDSWDIASDVRLSMVAELRKVGITLAVPARIIFNKQSTFARDDQSSNLSEKTQG